MSGVAVNSALTGHDALLAYIPLVLELCVMSVGDESLPGLANTVGSDPFDTMAVQGVDIRFSKGDFMAAMRLTIKASVAVLVVIGALCTSVCQCLVRSTAGWLPTNPTHLSRYSGDWSNNHYRYSLCKVRMTGSQTILGQQKPPCLLRV